MDRPKLLSLEKLSVWYSPGKNVLDNFSLELGDHEIVGLIGLNGAGKTTFIKTLSGLIDSFQISSFLWQGSALSIRDRTFKENRYTVFAEDHSFGYFTFREYLAYAAASYDVKQPDFSELARGFHFEDYVDVLLKELSPGISMQGIMINPQNQPLNETVGFAG